KPSVTWAEDVVLPCEARVRSSADEELTPDGRRVAVHRDRPIEVFTDHRVRLHSVARASRSRTGRVPGDGDRRHRRTGGIGTDLVEGEPGIEGVAREIHEVIDGLGPVLRPQPHRDDAAARGDVRAVAGTTMGPHHPSRRWVRTHLIRPRYAVHSVRAAEKFPRAWVDGSMGPLAEDPVLNLRVASPDVGQERADGITARWLLLSWDNGVARRVTPG